MVESCSVWGFGFRGSHPRTSQTSKRRAKLGQRWLVCPCHIPGAWRFQGVAFSISSSGFRSFALGCSLAAFQNPVFNTRLARCSCITQANTTHTLQDMLNTLSFSSVPFTSTLANEDRIYFSAQTPMGDHVPIARESV